MKTWGAFHWDKDTEWKKTMLKIWSLVSKGGTKMLIFAFAFFRFVSYIINYWILHVQVLRVFILEEVQINLSVLSPTSGPYWTISSTNPEVSLGYFWRFGPQVIWPLRQFETSGLKGVCRLQCDYRSVETLTRFIVFYSDFTFSDRKYFKKDALAWNSFRHSPNAQGKLLKRACSTNWLGPCAFLQLPLLYQVQSAAHLWFFFL